MARDFYLVLGLDRGANAEQIKRAYRKLVKEFHPDAMFSCHEGAAEHRADCGRFLEISEAYEVLSDPVKKADYDRTLAQSDSECEPVRVRTQAALGHTLLKHRKKRNRHSVRDYHLEVLLNPWEMIEGADIPLAIPLVRDCPICSGLGCALCAGTGRVTETMDFILHVPPGTGQARAYSLNLEDLGIKGIRLVIHLGLDYNFRH